MKLEILCYPDERLNKKAHIVECVNEEVVKIADDMLETMYEANGVGLAATQVNIQKRIIVIDISKTRDEPMVLINPEVVAHGSSKVVNEEGCLSVPDIYDDVQRWDTVVVQALDKQGQMQRIEADGLLSRCLQHEIDHLDGHVFVEYLSPLKRNRIRTKLVKRKREEVKSQKR